jgi:hypothetical protein
MPFVKQEVKAGDIMTPEWGNFIQTQHEEALPKYTSNANGECWRWDDGTQICAKRQVMSDTVGGNTTFAKTWTYPLPFANGQTPTVLLTGKSTTDNIHLSRYGVNHTSTTYLNARLAARNEYTSELTLMADVIAIGRWK